MGLISLLFSNPLAFFVLATVLLYAVIAHEVSHGVVALMFGDDTAKQAGRLSLNPLIHLDPMGTLMLLFVGFGWAKPVPVNYYRLTNFRLALFCVSLAGVFTNICLAIIALALLKAGVVNPRSILYSMVELFARINIILGAFNLIPVPPLDGSKIVMALLPREQQRAFMRFESMGFILLVILLFTGALTPLIMFIERLIYSLIALIL